MQQSQIKDYSSCNIRFLDCMGYYDLAAELISLLLATVILYKSIVNYRQLKKEKGLRADTQFERSIRRKINVNLMNILFLFCLLIQILFSMLLFQVHNEDKQQILNERINIWYKFVNIVDVDLLDTLILTVGFLYWRALRAFYTISELDIPFLYTKPIGLIFVVAYIYNFGVGISSLVILLTCDNPQSNISEIQVLEIINLIGTVISVVLCISSRFLYYTYILKSVRMAKKTIFKEGVYNVIILICSIIRITKYLLDIFEVDYGAEIRKYDANCRDTLPLSALVLLGVTILANLLPSYIFTNIFTTFEKQKKTQSELEKTLYSGKTSEYESKIESSYGGLSSGFKSNERLRNQNDK